MLRYIRWLWWTVYYAVTPRPKKLESFVQKLERTEKPWWRFKPNVWHNAPASQWEIRFASDRDYTEQRMLEIEVSVSMETGQIVGMTVYDELLKSHKQQLAELDAIIEKHGTCSDECKRMLGYFRRDPKLLKLATTRARTD